MPLGYPLPDRLRLASCWLQTSCLGPSLGGSSISTPARLGYVCRRLNLSCCCAGLPWTEDEHLAFLAGLKKLGKGNWRGIAKQFCPSRTSTQVASHAQVSVLGRVRLHLLFHVLQFACLGGSSGGSGVPVGPPRRRRALGSRCCAWRDVVCRQRTTSPRDLCPARLRIAEALHSPERRHQAEEPLHGA